MKTEYKKSFLNGIKKLRSKQLKNQILDVIVDVETAKSVSDIPNIKKLKGTKKNIYFRIKLNDYRIGVTIENEIVTFVVFEKRKDIYKFFP